MDAAGVVIVGASHAGVSAAVALREKGFAERIVVVGAEPHLPYQRPPLSKTFMKHRCGETELALRPETFYAAQGIELRLGQRVARIERTEQRLALAGGGTLPFGHLILATGARNRTLALPGADIDGIASLRDLHDAVLLRERLAAARDIVIIGGGFIGLELAATAAGGGAAVTVVEAEPFPLSRAVSAPIAQALLSHVTGLGVAIATDVRPQRFEGRRGAVETVRLGNGRTLPADLVIIGIGVEPNCELGAESGLDIANGLRVDHALATRDPLISAIGDCASFPSRFAGQAIRLESVPNATDHARRLAARLTGETIPAEAAPWFWSDIGARKLRIAGLTRGADIFTAGGMADGGHAILFFRDGLFVGAETVDRPADHMAARRLLDSGARLALDEARDAGFDLRALARKAAAPAAAMADG